MNFIFNYAQFYLNISIFTYHCLMSNLLCSATLGIFTDEDTFYIPNRSEKEEIIDIENLTDNTFLKNANTTKIELELKNDVITAENSYKIKTTNFIHFDKSEGKILNDLFDEQKQIIAKIGFLLIQFRNEDDFDNLDLHNNFEYLYFDLISSTEKICARMFYVLKKIFGTYYKQKKDILKKIKFIRKIQNLIKKKMNGKKGSLRTKICLKEELKKLMIFRSKIYRCTRIN
ncbi:hypothetical protein NBO_739g0001 [Nosema bombycis CQ1]|uniref:Uncharacterized protein n=1 Tax=Nosema bombycis (strain CQ1 / CVCC 102059) TaxID=578461 RepID=R0M1F4_NOSB1|nr:hypothetical protein NBO_739g0001 [Nosema bombycis CQ1]|eukprot:EOB11844.1 hypothetical protein NBO_739g0001 [Nosema bombycis CQ1]